MNRNIINKIVMLSVIFFIFSCGNGEESRTLKRQELPDVEVSADVDKVEAVIGDKILYSIRISSVPGIKVNVEELGEDIAGFKVVDWHGEAVAPRLALGLAPHEKGGFPVSGPEIGLRVLSDEDQAARQVRLFQRRR